MVMSSAAELECILIGRKKPLFRYEAKFLRGMFEVKKSPESTPRFFKASKHKPREILEIGQKELT